MAMKALQMILKKDLIHRIMKSVDHCLREKIKKVIRLMKDELGCKDYNKMCKTYLKTYSYLIDDGREDKKAKGTKKCI